MGILAPLLFATFAVGVASSAKIVMLTAYMTAGDTGESWALASHLLAWPSMRASFEVIADATAPAVPLPATAPLLLGAIGAAGAFARRRKAA